MKPGWEEITLGELCDIARGGSPRPIKNYITDDENGVNWIKIGDTELGRRYIDSTKQKILREGIKRSRWVEEGDFLLSNSMSFGRPYILRTSGCIHDGWLVLKPDYDKVDQDYLYFVLSSPVVFSQFDSLAAGSTVRNLNTKLVTKVVIPLPPLEEQRRIVALLDQAFEGLDRARANTEANLLAADSFVGDFSSAILGSPEQDWTTGTLSEFCTFEGGFAFKSGDSVSQSNVQLIRIGNLYNNVLDLNRKPVFYPDVFVETYRKFELQAGDLIMSLTGTVGKQDYGFVVEIPKTEQRLLLNQRVCRIRPRDSEFLSKEFLLRFLRSSGFLSMLYNISRGTRQANLSTKDMGELPISFPSPKVQLQVTNKISKIEARISRLLEHKTQTISELMSLRQSLLAKAFAGELT